MLKLIISSSLLILLTGCYASVTETDTSSEAWILVKEADAIGKDQNGNAIYYCSSKDSSAVCKKALIQQ